MRLAICCWIIFLSTQPLLGQDLATVVNRYFRAIGGEEVVASLTTSTSVYRTFGYYPKMDTMHIEEKQQVPGRKLSITYDNHNKVKYQTLIARDSIYIRLTNPYPTTISNPLKDPIDFDVAQELLRLFHSKRLRYLMVDTLNGIPCHILEARPEKNRPVKRFFFDNQTGLLSAVLVNENITYFKDYRVVNEYNFPFVREQYLNGMLLEIVRFEEINLDVELSEQDFRFKNIDPPSLRFENSKYNEVRFVDEYYNSRSLKEVLSLFQGTALLIDIWASWCGPCKAEFAKYDDQFYEYLATNNIKCLFISLDTPEKEKAWKKDVSYFNLNGSHLRADKNLRLSILKELNSGSQLAIPRYLLIGRNGDYLSTNLVRPSSPDFQKIITVLLAPQAPGN